MPQIIFVNPPLTLRERFSRFEKVGNIMPPLGLCYLASYTRSKGYETEILDAPADKLSYSDSVNLILKKRPQAVGITATTLSINNAARLASMLKERYGNIKVIIGGPHISSLPEETLAKLPEFDFGVIGEGEQTIVELLEYFNGTRGIEEIKGIIYRNKGEIKRSPPRPLFENLDEFPLPAWDMLPNYPHPYKPLKASFSQREMQGSIITSRGCPFLCRYCPKSVFGRKVRNHSVDYVVDMIRHQYFNFGVRDIEIYDDTLTLSKNRIKELCSALIKERLNLIWSANARIDQVDEEMLLLMKKAGCWKIGFGIESGDYGILEKMDKRVDLQDAKRMLRIANEMGFVNRGYFIIGYPTETRKSIMNTIKYAKESHFHMVQFNAFTPLPGSPALEDINRYGQFDNDWSKMNFVDIVFMPHGFDKTTLDRYIKRAYKEFYLRPWIALRFLKRVRNVKDLFRLVQIFFLFLSATFMRK